MSRLFYEFSSNAACAYILGIYTHSFLISPLFHCYHYNELLDGSKWILQPLTPTTKVRTYLFSAIWIYNPPPPAVHLKGFFLCYDLNYQLFKLLLNIVSEFMYRVCPYIYIPASLRLYGSSELDLFIIINQRCSGWIKLLHMRHVHDQMYQWRNLG